MLKRAVSGCALVFHLAARPSVIESIEDPIGTHAINLGGTLQTLEAARREAAVRRLVFASSCAVYGDTEILPLSEDLPPAPGSPYALHKLAAELYLGLYQRLRGLGTVALRFFNVFGPRQNPGSRYAAAVPILGAPVPARSWCDTPPGPCREAVAFALRAVSPCLRWCLSPGRNRKALAFRFCPARCCEALCRDE